MKKIISLLFVFIMLTGCGAKTKPFTPSAKNITNLLAEKDIPYTVNNFQHYGSSSVENVEQYTCSLANKAGENVYALVLNYEDETCCNITLLSMLKTKGYDEAQKMADLVLTMYGANKETAENVITSIRQNLVVIRKMIADEGYKPENGRLEPGFEGYNCVFLPSVDDELDYSDENIRLSTFYVESQEYRDKLEKARREERRKLIKANPKLYSQNAMNYPQLFDVDELNGKLAKMEVPFTVEFRSAEQSVLGVTYSYYDVYADGQPVGILYTEQFVSGASIDFTYNNIENKYHQNENATEYMVKTVCTAYGVDYTEPLKVVEETDSSVESKYYDFDGFYGEYLAVGDYSVVNKVPYHFELYDAELFKALLERDKDVSPIYADAYKEFFE